MVVSGSCWILDVSCWTRFLLDVGSCAMSLVLVRSSIHCTSLQNHTGETVLKPGLSLTNHAPTSHGSILDALDPTSTTIQSLSPTYGLIDIDNPQSGSLTSLPPLLQLISPSPLQILSAMLRWLCDIYILRVNFYWWLHFKILIITQRCVMVLYFVECWVWLNFQST